MWIALAVGLVALPFLSLPGRYVFDTRDPLWLNPGAYLSKALVLWHQSPYLGHEQHDAIAFPMALVVWVIRSLGATPWVAERLWHGLLLLTGTAGTILLVDRLRGDRSVVAPAAAGLAYTLAPYTFGYGLPFTGPYLPYVLLPILLLVVLVWLPRRGLAGPALFGLVTLLMGGGNGATQIDALITAFLLIAWVTFVQRGVTIGRGLAFGAWCALFVLGLNAWWLVLLRSSEVSNALSFSEQPSIINVSSSASETVRGLGFWQYYGGDQFGPWIPTVRAYSSNPLLVLTGFVLPVGALAGAWLTRWRHRLFFLFLLVVAVFVTAGVFPVHSPTPFGRLLLDAYRAVPGAAGLRTTYKFASALNLSIAILAAMALAAALRWVRSRPRGGLLRAGVVAAAVAVVAANAYPLWTGHLYIQSHSTKTVPRYWREALTYLSGRDTDTRAFFAPATWTAIYRWGALKEGVGADAGERLQHVDPIRLPVGERYGSNLVAAVEQPYFLGLPVAGEARMFRYLGVRDIVLQNDLDWQRTHSARPADMQALLENPKLQPLTSFGVPGENVVGPADRRDRRSRGEESLSPVQVLTVADPLPIVRSESPDPVVLSGDGFGLGEAARAGLLDAGPPVVYSGSLTADDLRALLARSHPTFVITDSNRREVWSFSNPAASHSYTLPAGQTIRGHGTGYELFDQRSATQTVARYPGVVSITASDYGSPLVDTPEFRPANAFDGDPATVWQVGQNGDPVGQWVKATFPDPTELSDVSVTVPPASLGRQVRLVRLEFSDGTSVTAQVPPGKTTDVTFTARTTTFLRVRILAVARGVGTNDNGVSIADLDVPGLHPTEILQVPRDLLDLLRQLPGGEASVDGLPFAYVFERARTGSRSDRDEEVRLTRRFEVPTKTLFSITGSVHLDRDAPDDEIDTAVLGDTDVHVTSSSRLFGSPTLRGSAALDGDPDTAWIPAGTVGESLTVSFPRHVIDHLEVDTSRGQDRTPILTLTAEFSDGSTAEGKLQSLLDGTIELDFPPTRTRSVTIHVDTVLTTTQATPPPIGIDEVRIPGVDPLGFRGSAILPCYRGPGFTIDGTPRPVQALGTERQFLQGKDLDLHVCGDAPVPLGAGPHLLEAGGPFQPDSVMLSGSGGAETAPASTPPAVHAAERSDGGYTVGIEDASSPYYLVIGQNIAPGWRASIGGKDLGPPLLVDGYSAGWFVTERGSYDIDVSYGPQRGYVVALGVSGITALVAVVLVLLAVRRRRWRGVPRTRAGGGGTGP